MNFAQEKNGSSRMVGIGIVVLIHIVIFWGLYLGLAKKISEAIKGPAEVKVIQEQVKPPPPPEKIIPPPPDIKTPPPPFVPPPEVVVTAPPPPVVMTAPTTTVRPPTTEVRPQVVQAPPAPPYKGPVTASAVCTKMGKPDANTGSWSGQASFTVTATVKAGRVTSTEIRTTRSPGDRKAERAMKSAIDEALSNTYECPGDHVFVQEFVFNIGD